MTRTLDRSRRDRSRGQSVVEFALVLPLMVILMLAITDMARIYTTMLTIESAVREAADYGTFGSNRWAPTAYNDVTYPNMVHRACIASSNLPDYDGTKPEDDTLATCTNPDLTYELSGDKGATWGPWSEGMGCALDPVAPDTTGPKREPPCWLRVTLEYDFKLLVPLNIEILGASYGVPNTITFERTSTFTMTDLGEPEPTP